MDSFDDLINEEKLDSLDEALGALMFALADELHEKNAQINDARTAEQINPAKISRLAGEEIVYQYAMGQFSELRDKFSEAGQKLLSLHDDPSFLPELMNAAMEQLKTMQTDGRLLKSAMILLPSQVPEISLERAAVAKGIGDALQWLESDLFPLITELCPPPQQNIWWPTMPRWPGPSL